MHVPIIIMAHESTASHTGFRWGMANMQYHREGDFRRVQFSPMIMLATSKIKLVKSYGLPIRKKMHSSIFFFSITYNYGSFIVIIISILIVLCGVLIGSYSGHRSVAAQILQFPVTFQFCSTIHF